MGEMTQADIRGFAESYTNAWCSHDPARVAAHYTADGTIAINGGDAAPIREVAQSFIDEFPDIRVFTDDVVLKDGEAEYHWTFTGTHAGTGKPVRISGFEEWTFADDGRVVRSLGHYDQAEYDRQVEHGV
jgi:nuclear transport factor 2 (NTF2) superfamily protein